MATGSVWLVMLTVAPGAVAKPVLAASPPANAVRKPDPALVHVAPSVE